MTEQPTGTEARAADLGRMFESLLERTPDGFLLISSGAIVEHANAAAHALLATEGNAITGTPITRWISGLDVHDGPQLSPVASQAISFDGRLFPVETCVIPIEDTGRFCVMFRDVSQREKSEEAARVHARNVEALLARRTSELDRSRTRYQMLYDLAPVLDFELDSEGSIASANRKACLSLGVSIDRLVGLPLTELAVGNERSAFQKGLNRIREGSLAPLETRLRSADGAVIDVLFHACRSEAAPSSLRLVGLDVTARREAERLVDQSLDLAEAQRARMERILRGIGEGLIVTDPDGQVRLMNSTAERFFSTEEKFAFGRDLFAEQPDPDFVATWERFTAGEGDLFSHNLSIAGSEERLVAVTVSRIRTPEGRPAGCAAVLRDITEDRKAEHHRDEVVSEFVHGLRTPLAAIRGFTATILRGEQVTDHDSRRFLGIVEDEALRLQHLVEDLIALASAGAGREILRRRPGNFVELLRDEKALFAPAAAEKQVTLQVHENDHDGTGIFDSEKMRRVLKNLIGNALKSTPAGGRVEVGFRRDGQQFECTVRDTGPGQSAEALEEAPGASGQGLGLQIARRLVELHEGTIRAENAPGEGSMFQFRIPVCPSVPEVNKTSGRPTPLPENPLIDDPDPLPLV